MRIVRAEELVEPINVEGARIVGHLNLEGRKLEHPLILRNCYVEEEINLRRAEIPHVDLSGSHLWGLDAEQLRTRDDIDLREVVTSGTEISLVGARIDGCLVLTDARLSNVNGTALWANGIVIAQDVLAARLSTAGAVAFRSAHVTRDVDLTDARLFNPGRAALVLESATADTVVCDGLRATGEVSLEGALIARDLSLSGATLSNGTGDALSASNVDVGGSALFTNATTQGVVWLSHAKVRGHLDFNAATLSCPMGVALWATSITVGQDLHFLDGFAATGEVDLTNATVEGVARVVNARLRNLGGVALTMRRATVGHDLLTIDSTCVGRIELESAHVRGQFRLLRTHVESISANALTVDKGLVLRVKASGEVRARGLKVAQDVTMRGRFDDVVSLVDARIDGRLDFDRTVLSRLDLEGVRAGTLHLLPRKAPEEVDLTNAKVGTFEDDPDTWPETVWLRGFTYDVLEHDDAPVTQRVQWLRRNPGGYTPGLYDNLAAAYKRAGRVEYARQVNIAKQSHRRTEMNRIARAWNWLLYLTVGYGYRTSLAWIWLALLLGAGTAVFANTTPKPTAPVVEAFNPFVYALDALLPIVDLGQQKAWVVQGVALWCSWGLIAAGWVLTTAVVAGLTNALKRD